MTAPDDIDLTFLPVTTDRIADFETFFGASGSPNYCWCMAWRPMPSQLRSAKGPVKKAMMLERIEAGEPVGLLAYHGGAVVGWVSIAPRDTYRPLGGPKAAADENVWSLACMFLKRGIRSHGAASRLVSAAIEYASAEGATIVEAYPVEPDSPSYRFMGLVPSFERLGFTFHGMAGTRRHVMRFDLAP